MTRLWLIPLVGALLAPLVTWLPMLAIHFRGTATQTGQLSAIGLPIYEPSQGMDIWSVQTFWLVIFSLIALLVGHRDRWLGCTVFTLGAGIFLWGGTFDVTHRILFGMGALALWVMRQTPTRWHPMILALLAASGVFQAAYALQQYLGYDVLWVSLFGNPGAPVMRAVGTIGTVDATAAYVAITSPLMPWWLLPLAIPVVLKSHSIGAICALGVGLLVRYHRRWWLTTAVVALLVGVYLKWFIPGGVVTPHMPTTVSGRLAIWQFALADWWDTNPLVGLGSWAQRIPTLQITKNVRPNGEMWREAHSEYLQWLYETGLVGASLAGLWLWEHRRMFRDRAVGASLGALAVVSASFFTFHVVALALLGVILVALATPHEHLQEVA